MSDVSLWRTPTKWSKADTEYLINNAGKVPTKDIAAKLGRSLCSIQRKADFEGIPLAPGKRKKLMESKFDPSTLPGHDKFILVMCKLRQLTLNIPGRVNLNLDSLKQAYEIVRKITV